MPGILPPLSGRQALEVTRVHSVAGTLGAGASLITRPPFRMPHHSASLEGLIGGGRMQRPGEVSLAHGGVLFLDETPEFRTALLQALREPLESREVTVVRAGYSVRYPAGFQLICAANPCPCGNLGRDAAVCLCSPPTCTATGGGSAGRCWTGSTCACRCRRRARKTCRRRLRKQRPDRVTRRGGGGAPAAPLSRHGLGA